MNIEKLLQQQVVDASAQKTPLRIEAGNSKPWYGRAIQGNTLSLASHSGVVLHEPDELIVIVRAGTSLRELEATLAERNQQLTFEPPHFSEHSTIGGTVACGLSGPRRPWSGAARDAVLGCRMINGKGEILQMGGQVMKNVAGYDVSRLMCGAQGTLGVITELTLRVMPIPAASQTLVQRCTEAEARSMLTGLGNQPLPLSGTLYMDGRLYIRLSGARGAVDAALSQLDGETLINDRPLWQQLRDQKLPFFTSSSLPLWRLSLPPAAPLVPTTLHDDPIMTEWGGAQRWCYSNQADALRNWVAQHQGHASCLRHAGSNIEPFQPLVPGLLVLQQRLKQQFDPANILNPGRLYPEL